MKITRRRLISILALAALDPMLRAQEPVVMDSAREAILSARKFNINNISRPHDFPFSKLPEPDLVRDLMNYKKQVLVRIGIKKPTDDTIVAPPRFGGWDFSGFRYINIRKAAVKSPLVTPSVERQFYDYRTNDLYLNGTAAGLRTYTP